MKLGKLEFNSKGWFWNKIKIVNPFVMLWRLLWFPAYAAALACFMLIALIAWCDTRNVSRIWRDYRPF